MIPTLHALLKAAARLYKVSETDIRLGFDGRVRQALGVFVWMAAESTEHDAAAVAVFAGHSVAVCQEAQTHVEAMMEADQRFRPLLNETMIKAMVLDDPDAVRRSQVAELTAAEIAQRLLGGSAEAFTLGARHYQQIAAAFLAQADEIAMHAARITRLKADILKLEALGTGHLAASQSVARSWRDYERDQYSPGQRLSRERLERAVTTLADIHLPLSKPAKKKTHV